MDRRKWLERNTPGNKVISTLNDYEDRNAYITDKLEASDSFTRALSYEGLDGFEDRVEVYTGDMSVIAFSGQDEITLEYFFFNTGSDIHKVEKILQGREKADKYPELLKTRQKFPEDGHIAIDIKQILEAEGERQTY